MSEVPERGKPETIVIIRELSLVLCQHGSVGLAVGEVRAAQERRIGQATQLTRRIQLRVRGARRSPKSTRRHSRPGLSVQPPRLEVQGVWLRARCGPPLLRGTNLPRRPGYNPSRNDRTRC